MISEKKYTITANITHYPVIDSLVLSWMADSNNTCKFIIVISKDGN